MSSNPRTNLTSDFSSVATVPKDPGWDLAPVQPPVHEPLVECLMVQMSSLEGSVLPKCSLKKP
jgi:hypothetical protein